MGSSVTYERDEPHGRIRIALLDGGAQIEDPLIKAVHSPRLARFGQIQVLDKKRTASREEHVVLSTTQDASSLPAPVALRTESSSIAAVSLTSSPVRYGGQGFVNAGQQGGGAREWLHPE